MSVLDLITIPREKRSVSPLTPSPSKDLRGIRLFRAISRKLSRISQEGGGEDDSRSSSTDSFSSTSRSSRSQKLGCSSVESGFRSASPNHTSSSNSSDAGSDCQSRARHHHHSTSAESIRKVFQTLSVSSRSQSCTNTRECKKKNSKKPKKILRAPVSYTYVKGLSGLPTQRVPRTPSRVYLNSSTCSCTMQYKAGLNR